MGRSIDGYLFLNLGQGGVEGVARVRSSAHDGVGPGTRLATPIGSRGNAPVESRVEDSGRSGVYTNL